jgi:hypothetical protein
MMTSATIRHVLAGAAMALIVLAAPARAQDISPSHLDAARAALVALHATDDLDKILPQAAENIKKQLIDRNPDQSELINSTVDEQTLALAGRRGDLEKEVAMAYAKVFTEDELKKITEFYSTPVGQKLISDGPIASREMLKAANIWQSGIIRDLSNAVGQALVKAAPDTYGSGAGGQQDSNNQNQ